MKLKESFLKLKLPSNVTTIYRNDFNNKLSNKASSIDSLIWPLYVTYKEKIYTLEWCKNVHGIVNLIDSLSLNVLNRIEYINEYKEMKRNLNSIENVLNFEALVSQVYNNYEKKLSVVFKAVENDEFYDLIYDNKATLDLVSNFLKDTKKILEGNITPFHKEIQNEYSLIKNHYSTLNDLFTKKETEFNVIDFEKQVEELFDEYAKKLVPIIESVHNGEFYILIHDNKKTLDLVNNFLKDAKPIAEALTKRVSKNNIKNQLVTIENNYSTLNTLMAEKERLFVEIDICRQIETLYTKYAKKIAPIKEASKNGEFYNLIHDNKKTLELVNTFLKEAEPIYDGFSVNFRAKDEIYFQDLAKFESIIHDYYAIKCLMFEKDAAYEIINLERLVKEKYDKYFLSIEKYMSLCKKDELGFYKEILANINFVNEYVQEMKKVFTSTNLKKASKLDEAFLTKFYSLHEQYNSLNDKLIALESVKNSIEIDKRIVNLYNKHYENLLKMSNSFDKNINYFYQTIVRTERNKFNAIAKEAKEIYTAYSNSLKNYITQLNKLNALIKLVNYLTEAFSCSEYYDFIKHHSTNRYDYYKFSKLDSELSKKHFKHIRFPFSKEWDKLAKKMYKYNKKYVAKERRKHFFVKCGKVILAPFKFIFYTFLFKILIQKIILGFFKGIAILFKRLFTNSLAGGLMFFIAQFALLVLMHVNMKFFADNFDITTSFIIPIDITLVIVMIECLVPTFRRSEHYSPWHLLLRGLYPFAVGCALVFLKKCCNLGQPIIWFTGIGFIATGICFGFDEYNDFLGILIFSVGNLILLTFALVNNYLMHILPPTDNGWCFGFYNFFILLIDLLIGIEVSPSNEIGFDNLRTLSINKGAYLLFILSFLFYALSNPSGHGYYLWFAIPMNLGGFAVWCWNMADAF